MSNHLHRAIIHWEQPAVDFFKGQYSREHTWTFDGGAVIPASAAPSVVPAPWSNPALIDPEEAHLHHAAHEQCFIANSVNTEVTVSQGSTP